MLNRSSICIIHQTYLHSSRSTTYFSFENEGNVQVMFGHRAMYCAIRVTDPDHKTGLLFGMIAAYGNNSGHGRVIGME